VLVPYFIAAALLYCCKKVGSKHSSLDYYPYFIASSVELLPRVLLSTKEVVTKMADVKLAINSRCNTFNKHSLCVVFIMY